MFKPLPPAKTARKVPQKATTLPDPILSLEQVPADEPILYIDGGAQFRLQKTDIPPGTRGFSLGDGDSFDGELDEKLNQDKDYSDLAYALANIPAQFSKLHLLGFLGERRDHEWINLGEIHHFLAERHRAAHAHLHSPTIGEHITGFTAGDWQFRHHGTFSLLTLHEARLTLTGECRYPLKTAATLPPLSSLGLSNTAHGDVQIHCDQPFFLITQKQV